MVMNQWVLMRRYEWEVKYLKNIHPMIRLSLFLFFAELSKVRVLMPM